MSHAVEKSIRSWAKGLDYALDEDGAIPVLERSINRNLLDGGKRLRPALCTAFGAVLGIAPEKTAPYARTVERVHAASLAHDDVIDYSHKRRGKPTLNALFSNTQAVLGGNYLLSQALIEASTQGNLVIVEDLARTLREMVTGEWLQFEARGECDVSREHLLDVAEKKTASLFRWGCRVGAYLAGGDEILLKLASQFCNQFGIGFQMLDDVVDFSGEGGKPYGLDFKEGLMNFVTFDLYRTHAGMRRAIASGLKEFTSFPWTDQELGGACARIREQAHERFVLALNLLLETRERSIALGRKPDESAYEMLTGLVSKAKERTR